MGVDCEQRQLGGVHIQLFKKPSGKVRALKLEHSPMFSIHTAFDYLDEENIAGD